MTYTENIYKLEDITEIRLKDRVINGNSIEGLSVLNSQDKEFIYLMESQHGCKIGKTSQPAKRLSAIFTLLPFYLSSITLIEVNNAYEVENILHREYEDKRIKGEWFNLNEIDRETIRMWNEIMLISWHTEIPF